MKGMIYYPGFEVKDETWLKFALLYLDRIRPIVVIGFSKQISRYSETVRFIG